MNRKSDIDELLVEVDVIINELNQFYSQAKSDESINQLPRIKVKSALEHLRSTLDYCALDIHEKYYTGKGKIYFPYGLSEELFKKHLKRSFKNIHDKAPKVYEIIQSIQSFKTGNDWLLVLCNAVNSNKHNKLSTQTSKKEQVTRLPGFGRVSGGGKMVIYGGSVNGVPIAKDDSVPIVLSNESTYEEMQNNLNPNLSIVRTTEKVEFILDNTGWDALKLLAETREGVFNMIGQLYCEITANN